jgi:hypothetical protein
MSKPRKRKRDQAIVADPFSCSNSEQRIFKMLHGYYRATDFMDRTILPKSIVALAQNSRFKRVQVKDILWDEAGQKCTVVIYDGKRSRKIDPKRCIVLQG